MHTAAEISRRSFLGEAFSFGTLALGGCAFRAPAGVLSGAGANLVFGVVSDIHVGEGRGDFKKFGDASQFEKTLRWFDEQGVDGVIVAGDMAENGMINQIEHVGAAWFRVFPDGKSLRDGRRVEQLFVYGNHDFEGQGSYKYATLYREQKSFESFWIRRDPAKVWRDVFREDYSPIWMKTVKGYQFIGAHWSLGKDPWGGIPEVEPWFRDNAAKIDRTKPFFFIQHIHPQGTVYSYANPNLKPGRATDRGYATRALSAFPNAIAFSGHTHYSLTDERSIWQGAFTSVGASSLRFGGSASMWEQRQGMLVKVYDDRVVIVRRDFLHDQSLGDDWVIPLPACTDERTRPLSCEARAARNLPPEFADGAKVAVKREDKGWLLTIPPADAAATRSFRFEIATGLAGKSGKPVVFHAWDAKYNMPRALAGAPTKYLVKFETLPKDADGNPQTPTFTVTPYDSFGVRGKPKTADVWVSTLSP